MIHDESQQAALCRLLCAGAGVAAQQPVEHRAAPVTADTDAAVGGRNTSRRGACCRIAMTQFAILNGLSQLPSEF
jgi:hypothetical protein